MKRGPPKASDKLEREKWKTVFLLELAKNFGNVGLACSLAGVSRETAYQYRKSDKNFRKMWAGVKKAIYDNLEAAGIERATKGVRKPVYQQGRKVGHVQEFSDGLVIPLLKAGKRKYRQADKDSESDKPPISIGPIVIKCAGEEKTISGQEPKHVDASAVQGPENHLPGSGS